MTETLPLPPTPAVAKHPKQPKPQAASDPVNDPIRQQLAFDAYRILITAQATSGKFSEDIVGTWMWKFADAAIRGKSKLHRPSLSQTGITFGPPPEPEMPTPAILPPLDEVQ